MVVIEEIQRLKCELENDHSPSETIVSSLKLLGAKNLSKDVLLTTKIGHTVNRLRRHGSNEVIREQAKLVFRRWRSFIRDSEKEKSLIEVHCDKKTEVLRGKARQFLADALHVTVSTLTATCCLCSISYDFLSNNITARHTNTSFSLQLETSGSLPELIERTMFQRHGRLISNNYKRRMRSLVFTLKHQDAIRKKVLSGEIPVDRLVSLPSDQLTS